MLEKGAFQKVSNPRDFYQSVLFLVEKKDGGQRPVTNLKNLNKHIPYLHFKMEGLFLLRYFDSKRLYDKIRFERCIFFSIFKSLSVFSGREKIYEFLCMCFGLGPAPRLFTKLMKVPISLLRKLNIRVIVYLDDFLVVGKTIQEILKACHTIIFLLQNLGFLINVKKSVLIPSQKIEFLGMEIDSTKMLLILPEKKIKSISAHFQKLLDKTQVSVREISKLVGTLSSMALAVLHAPLHYRALQGQNIQVLAKNRVLQCYSYSFRTGKTRVKI